MLVVTGFRRKIGRRIMNQVVCDLCSHTHWVENREVSKIHRCRSCYNLGNLSERIKSHCVVIGECHMWTGCKTHDGYAIIGVGKRKVRVAKYVLEIKLGRNLLPSMETCHTCNNRSCVNPCHLFEGTHKTNMEQMSSIGSVRGTNNGNAKITCEVASAIKNMINEGRKNCDIASLFGIPVTVVENIKYGNSWCWV